MIHLCAMSCISSVLTPFPPLFCNSEFLEWGPGEAAPGSGDRPHPLGPWVLGREADPDHDVDVAPEAGDGGKLHQHCLRGGGRQLHPPHPVWRPQLTAWIRSVALCVLSAHSNSLCNMPLISTRKLCTRCYLFWKLSQILTVYVEICLIIYYRDYKLDK